MKDYRKTFEKLRARREKLDSDIKKEILSIFRATGKDFFDLSDECAWTMDADGLECVGERPVYGVGLDGNGVLMLYMEQKLDEEYNSVCDRDGEKRHGSDCYITVNWLSVLDAVIFAMG